MNLPFAQTWSKLSGTHSQQRPGSPLTKLSGLWRRRSAPRARPADPQPAARPRRTAGDTLKASALYRLKRDSLVIVAKMNEGRGAPSLDAFKRQVVFVQSQLVLAAIRDPDLPVETKAALVGFQEASIRESIEDRRGCARPD